MNLGEMRNYIREHIDLDDVDVSNTLIDNWLREGHSRIQEFSHNWPHLLAEVEATVDTIVDISAWRAVHDVRIDRWTLREIPHSSARKRWPNTMSATGTPTHYSIVGRSLYLWPKPATIVPASPGSPESIDWPGPVSFVSGVGAPTYPTNSTSPYADTTHFNYTTGHGADLYVLNGTTWVGPMPLVYGTGAPSSATVADDGDYYVDTTVPYYPVLYGPRVTNPEVPESAEHGGVTIWVRGVKEPATWPASGASNSSSPINLPTRLHELVARWALSNAYQREGDQQMAQMLRVGVAEELTVYSQRVQSLTNSERFSLADGGGDNEPERMRYSWE